MTWDVTAPIGITLGSLPHVSGRFYDSRIHTTLTTFTVTVNVLYGMPFYVPTTTTYTAISIEVTTLSVGNHCRLGIYNDSTGAPGGLVLDAGTILTTTTGGKSIVISQSLSAGWYWLALVSDSSVPVLRAYSQTNALAALGYTSGTDTTNHVGVSVAFTYAALPNPFTAGSALMTTAAPRVMLGV